MGILQRFGDIVKSNVNAMLDKAEDPAKMVDQMLLDLRRDLAEVKKETAGVMPAEKNAKRLLEYCESDIQKYTVAAQNALRAGNEADARALLTKKQELEANLASAQTNYNAAKNNADKMREMHSKLVQDIDSLESRKATIKAKMATAKAQSTVNKITAGMSSGSSLEAFDRMERKADQMLDAATAEAELNAGSSPLSDLADKYTTGEASVDEELEKMRQELGL